jgi:isocitrate/isopropylmalate dehydrogenase
LATKKLIGDEAMKEKVNRLVSQQRLNGRQIRNIIRSAMALAQSEEKPVTLEHFEMVIDSTVQFQDQIDEMNRKRRQDAERKTLI